MVLEVMAWAKSGKRKLASAEVDLVQCFLLSLILALQIRPTSKDSPSQVQAGAQESAFLT